MENKKPSCFTPEENIAYPLCIGKDFKECDFCNLNTNIVGEGGYENG